MSTAVPHARAALDDARHVRAKLEDELDEREWRLQWVLVLTLLRVIGHVLDKVDAASNPALRAITTVRYAQWKCGPSHVVFHSFIETERNLILKEYRTSLWEGPAFAVSTDDEVVELFDLAEGNLFRPLEGGPYAGEDGRDIIDDALRWWQEQLDSIDRELR